MPGPNASRNEPQYPTQVIAYTEPAGGNRAGSSPPTELNIRQQGPYSYQTEIVHSGPAGSGDSKSLPAGDSYRLAQNVAGPELIRPGAVPIAAAQSAAPQVVPEPENRFQGLLPPVGPPPALGPVPTPEVQQEYAQFADGQVAPQETIEVVVGRAVVKVLWEKPRRIYIPSEDFATCQVVTDQQIAIAGKRPGRTVLDFWFPDPRNPNDPSKDRVLSYMIVVLPDTGGSELQRWQETEASGG